MEQKLKKYKKVLEGRVVSDKMDKTIVVEIQSRQMHPLYGKTISKSKRFKAHDEKNECIKGDVVRIVECRPLSKDKTFRLMEIVKKVERIDEVDTEKDVQSVLKREKHAPVLAKEESTKASE